MGGEAGREAAACGLYMWVLKPRGSEETLDLLDGLLGPYKWAFFEIKWAVTNMQRPPQNI